jgi:hypothetical protein
MSVAVYSYFCVAQQQLVEWTVGGWQRKKKMTKTSKNKI